MKRIAQYGAVIGAVVVLLSGCSEESYTTSQPSADTGTPPQGDNPPQIKFATESAAADSRKANLPEIDRVTATVRSNNDKNPGTLTAIMRSVEANDRVMNVKFAVQWDSPEESVSAKLSSTSQDWNARDLIAVDTMNLTAYRPLCTKGLYKSPSGGDQIHCYASQLRWPRDVAASVQLVNHVLTEGNAVLPAPEGRPATLDISLGSPLPTFTAVPVTYR
ncbi:MAG: hypothetical protein FWF12_05290 [Betaproteobacteria bacterium]|nr:hypothetical protein [Betaproteobacteria bacterium]